MQTVKYGDIDSILIFNGAEENCIQWDVGESVFLRSGEISGVIAEIIDTSDEYGTNFVCTDDKGNALLYFTGGSYQLRYKQGEEK